MLHKTWGKCRGSRKKHDSQERELCFEAHFERVAVWFVLRVAEFFGFLFYETKSCVSMGIITFDGTVWLVRFGSSRPTHLLALTNNRGDPMLNGKTVFRTLIGGCYRPQEAQGGHVHSTFWEDATGISCLLGVFAFKAVTNLSKL
jgi:hypothetical protein